ncbi:hypothetical protein K458DRAFT_470983 [Lentithecium fluviatile CBS 122367]|uniref:Uncharacterized protein n=1 Tax=Lentithecium fluviatile CBS 122367 TaxID=1168545 RepID=A0A6G1J9Y1_9PLEO|nr:hypothetical protein K458DRAFT_470983 [Lentithecium fluviatile CBS 122367]
MKRDRTYLLDSIEAHGDKLLRRWRKRSSMPTGKWTITRLQYAGTCRNNARKDYRNVYLLPYLDIETLGNRPSVLIGLLNYRAYSPPAEWAQHDHHELMMGWACGVFDIIFNKNCVVMYGSDYGKLVTWTERTAHQPDIIGFPRVWLILEKQAYLMSFLRRVVEALLGDVTNDEPQSSAKWKELIHKGLRKSEPVYMGRYTGLLAQMHLVAKDCTNVCALEVIACEIAGDIVTHWFWQGAVDELEHTRVAVHRHRDSIRPGHSLPNDMDKALDALEVLLLQAIIPQRPSFSHWCDFRRDAKTGGTSSSVKPKSLGTPDNQRRFPFSMMLNFLDAHLASSPPVERSRLDEILFDKVSDYATIMELLAAVRMHCSERTIRDVHEIVQNEDRIAWRRAKAKMTALPKDYILDQPLKQFQSPPSGRRDQQTLFNVACFFKDIKNFMRPVTRQDILAGILKKDSKLHGGNDLFLSLPTSGEVPSRSKIAAPTVKEKTREKEIPPPLGNAAEVAEAEEDSAPTALVVSKRTLSVLRSMFPATSEERQTSTEWETFVQSMQNAGFSAKNRGGSTVPFEQVSGSRKIIFHRPHPVPKIHPIMLQSMGRRMNKWYGWRWETFMLAGK